MDNTIERIKKRIEARKWKITDDAFIPEIIGMQYANNMNDWCLEIIDEELAKEPQEEPNIPLECVDGSCPMALSDEYEERGMDVVHSCAECPYQPQVQPIVRSIDEIADAANMSCPPRYCEHDCGSPEYECKQCWIEWLTKKEV